MISLSVKTSASSSVSVLSWSKSERFTQPLTLCKTLYQYVKKIADVPNEPVGNWRNICDRLQEAGYQTQSSPEFKLNNSIPTEALIKIVNIGFKESTVSIDINIQLTLPSTSETPKTEDLDKKD